MRSSGSGADTDSQSAQYPPRVKRSDALREKKYQGAHERRRHCDNAASPAADLVGQSSEQQQCGQVSNDVGGINQSQGDLREAELRLVDDVERREHGAAREQRANHRGNDAYRRGAAEFHFS